MKHLFISDLHLDDERSAALAAFERFCAGPARHADALWILGDLFELWVGDDSPDAIGARVADALSLLSTQGTRCRIMHGNRDFLMGAAFMARSGAELAPDPIVIDGLDPLTVAAHGDALCTDDAQYQQVRAHLRSDAFRSDMLSRPLAEREAIGAQARARSRETNANKPDTIMDVNPTAVDALLDAQGAARLIHGHTHRPGHHCWERDGVTRERWVLGAWEHAPIVYAEADASGIRLVEGV